MRALRIMVVVAVLSIVVAAHCSDFNGVSARALGMGGASVGVADDAFAWIENPAGLASLAAAPKEGAKWSWDVAAEGTFSTREFGGDKHDAWGVTVSACDPSQGLGFGVGGAQDKVDNDKTRLWGAGFGIKGRTDSTKDWAIGVSVRRQDKDVTTVSDITPEQTTTIVTKDKVTLYDLGLMYDVKIADALPAKIGLVCRNVGDKNDGRTFDAGISLKASDRLLVAADLSGLGQSNRDWMAGGEYRLNEWAFRAGDASGQLALGVGYQWNNWCIDYAHTQRNGSKVNLVTVSTHF
jgi:hypothetical protein